MSNAIDITKITNPSKTGSFDVITGSLVKHIETLLTLGAFTQQEYAQIYTQLMTVAIQQSFSFELQRVITEKQADLLEAQIATENANTLNVAKQLELLGKDLLIKTQQLANMEAEKLQIEAQTAIAVQQKLNLVEELEQIKANKLLTDEQINKMADEIALLKQQKLNLEEEKLNLAKQRDLMTSQIDGQTKQNLRTDEEIKFTKQKVLSEEAQIADTLSNGSTVAGVIGKQKNLFTEQAKAFDNQHKLRIYEVFKDIYSISRSTDPDAVTPDVFYFTPAASKDAADVIRATIGLPPLA